MEYINKIYNENCLDTMARIIEPVVDLVVTSPPYDDLRDYKGYIFDFQPITKELYRIVKPGGVVVWIVGDSTINGSETGTSFKQAIFFKEIGFNLHDTMIYEKNTSAFPAKRNDIRYTQIFEYMFIFSKGQPKTVHLLNDKQNRFRGTYSWGKSNKRQIDGTFKESNLTNIAVKNFGIRNNIWRYVCSGGFGQSDSDAYDHPATFPEELAADHIKSWSNENDLVFDPMSGSGTTLIMARQFKRNYLGCEISEEYFKLIKKRLNTLEKIEETWENFVSFS